MNITSWGPYFGTLDMTQSFICYYKSYFESLHYVHLSHFLSQKLRPANWLCNGIWQTIRQPYNGLHHCHLKTWAQTVCWKYCNSWGDIMHCKMASIINSLLPFLSDDNDTERSEILSECFNLLPQQIYFKSYLTNAAISGANFQKMKNRRCVGLNFIIPLCYFPDTRNMFYFFKGLYDAPG